MAHSGAHGSKYLPVWKSPDALANCRNMVVYSGLITSGVKQAQQNEGDRQTGVSYKENVELPFLSI